MITDETLDKWAEITSKASTAPWTIEVGQYTGKDWIIGMCLGASNIDGNTYNVTTDHVHASELEGDAKTDAEFIVTARNEMVPKLIQEAIRMRNAIRTANNLEELTRMVGPTKEENNVAGLRIERIEALYGTFGNDVSRWPESARARLDELTEKQNKFEQRYA